MNRPFNKDMIIDVKERIIEAINSKNKDIAIFFVETLTDVALVLYDISIRSTASNLHDAIGNVPGVLSMAIRDVSEQISDFFKNKGK